MKESKFERFMKTYFGQSLMLLIKFGTAVRTGLDTLIVVGALDADRTVLQLINALIYMLLIDLVFTGLWIVAEYGGESQKMQQLRPYAITGAWIMYIGMVVVGWDAHPESPFLALLARIAGAVALGYTTSSTMSVTIKAWREEAQIRKAKYEFQRSAAGVYQTTVQKQLIKSIKGSAPKIGERMRSIVGERIDTELEEVVLEILPVPDEVAGNIQQEKESYQQFLPITSTARLRSAWESCRESLRPGQEFRRINVEECTTLARSRAGDVIKYGESVGEVVKIGHGRYRYSPLRLDVTDNKSLPASTDPTFRPPEF